MEVVKGEPSIRRSHHDSIRARGAQTAHDGASSKIPESRIALAVVADLRTPATAAEIRSKSEPESSSVKVCIAKELRVQRY